MADTYIFDVEMTCGGCSGAINKVLQKIEGLESFSVSLENKTVTVVPKDGLPTFNTVLEKIKGTGKAVKAARVNDDEQPI